MLRSSIVFHSLLAPIVVELFLLSPCARRELIGPFNNFKNLRSNVEMCEHS